jgi:MFS superfamily sulfate permease-like transporter
VRRLFPSLHGYERSWLQGDLVAGLTVWAVLVPEGLGAANVAAGLSSGMVVNDRLSTTAVNGSAAHGPSSRG